MAKELTVVYRPIDELIPYENNPRFNENAVDAVAASIEEFGFRQPIVIGKNNVIIAGHTRLLAAKRLDLLAVPCLIADDLSEEQVRAYRLADNKTAELAEWDLEKMMEELDHLSLDMTVFGFEDDAEFNSDVADKDESEYEPTQDNTVTCPSCGLTFSPIDG